ncbi:hypothetical protein [Methylobacterium isbiliense]|jgi:hypothetical protein|uniref:Uncharacterized protein n=1 Tax=Methylobacterium isbiliense TaxID=315478 RepID=A0ABQ4SI35_9HYPH|nr:hypothetical protein [Methylobacterium isbiliense]MDN3624325.1 hypothetical protein [Methylobacterium isbiliense]GJE01400.1 hypothetical protein GMJLKIPL_3330 [Methylobacterium isbiliense]
MTPSTVRTETAARTDAALPGAHSFTAALCGFLGSTAATTVVMVLLSAM